MIYATNTDDSKRKTIYGFWPLPIDPNKEADPAQNYTEEELKNILLNGTKGRTNSEAG